ncbi:MAG: hypothetical protein QMD46_02770 [Methanomicrobiales archaeon]|nr:hypothetical protein [Methanomicrobiales archaeon]MDI6875363.1 hypothetical protein [Methanomicrobiales archaeon]
MRRHALALSLLPLVVRLGSALTQEENTAGSLQVQDYFIIFLAAIIYVNLFLVLLYKIFKTTGERRSKFIVVNLFGMAFAFLLISLGYIQIIFSGLVIASIVTGMPMFAWTSYLTVYYFGSITMGVVVLGALGFLSLLVGLYILVMLRGNPLSVRQGMPDHSGNAPSVLVGGEDEPINPNVTFRVVSRDTGEPGIDVKLILQEREGSRIYEKYTDFNGEVTFQNIAGFASDYYAHVEGDESRAKFRVYRSRISSDSDR